MATIRLTPSYLRMCAMLVLPLFASIASAQSIPTMRLLNPSHFESVGMSPSGSRLAALTINGGERGLIVMEWRGGAPSPILTTQLDNHRSITNYRWLTDDYLFIYYADFAEDDNSAVPAIVSIPKRNVTFLDRFTTLVKAPWGDDRHVLLSTPCDVGTANFKRGKCLKSADMSNGNGDRIADHLELMSLRFLALSPTQIYARGIDIAGTHREYALDARTHQWQLVVDGTFARLQAAEAADKALANRLQAAASAGIHDGTVVYTEPGHHAIGVIGRAPEPAFVALDSRLDSLQALLEQTFPGARAAISGLNDGLTRGLVSVWDADQPARNFFFNDSGGLSEIAQLSPQIDHARLGRTHIERNWVSGVPVAVTLPPSGVALTGAVVEPLIASEVDGEEPLHQYAAAVQALAQHGIAVVRELAPMPDAFSDGGAGAAWRKELIGHLQSVAEHVSSDLLAGRPACLYGVGTDGELALAAGKLPHVGCTVALNALLDSKPKEEESLGKTRYGNMGPGTVGARGVRTAHTYLSVSDLMLNRDMPAVFGTAASGPLTDASQWIDNLPSTVMLSYNMRVGIYADTAGASQSFRAAAQKAGSTVVYFAPDPGKLSNTEYFANMLDAAADYVVAYYKGITTTAAR